MSHPKYSVQVSIWSVNNNGFYGSGSERKPSFSHKNMQPVYSLLKSMLKKPSVVFVTWLRSITTPGLAVCIAAYSTVTLGLRGTLVKRLYSLIAVHVVLILIFLWIEILIYNNTISGSEHDKVENVSSPETHVVACNQQRLRKHLDPSWIFPVVPVTFITHSHTWSHASIGPDSSYTALFHTAVKWFLLVMSVI